MAPNAYGDEDTIASCEVEGRGFKIETIPPTKNVTTQQRIV